MSVFSNRIKKLRGNMSIDELVSRLNEKYQTKISKSMISRYENGQADPKMETVRIFADFFNVSADYLMGIEEKIQIDTIAAHHDGDEWTEEELEEIEKFKEFVRSKRKQQE